MHVDFFIPRLKTVGLNFDIVTVRYQSAYRIRIINPVQIRFSQFSIEQDIHGLRIIFDADSSTVYKNTPMQIEAITPGFQDDYRRDYEK